MLSPFYMSPKFHVQLFVTPWTAAYQTLLSMGILHGRILEWVAIPSCRGSSQLKDQTQISCIAGGIFYHLSHQGNPRVGSQVLLQGIFPTQGSNLGLLPCRQILYHLSYQGSPLQPKQESKETPKRAGSRWQSKKNQNLPSPFSPNPMCRLMLHIEQLLLRKTRKPAAWVFYNQGRKERTSESGEGEGDDLLRTHTSSK